MKYLPFVILLALFSCKTEKPSNESPEDATPSNTVRTPAAKNTIQQAINEKAAQGYFCDAPQCKISLDLARRADAFFENIEASGAVESTKDFYTLLYEEAPDVKYYKTLFVNDGVEFTDVFGMKSEELIYAFESINPADGPFWNCQYIIEDGEVVEFISLGHGETESDDWEPESILKQWQERKADIDARLTSL